ncbi:uncharacterized protein LOC129727169 isoform X2 [Wyeomyia smithii]|uniref:uncharacterized protein LOC129727169 isoform X2 n=1 Tax=Wyeomyia smithii TaxID=174621 RepID=UPI0024681EA8|nr:uncharacterized protein LOC129727169 isoform X2 [Wyeomyia smithii]
MPRKLILSRIDSGIPKPRAHPPEPQNFNILRRQNSTYTTKENKSNNVVRAKSVDHSIHYTSNQAPQRPWSSSSSVDRKPRSSATELPKFTNLRPLGFRPSYLHRVETNQTNKSVRAVPAIESTPRIEDEEPPCLVASEDFLADETGQLSRQDTFVHEKYHLRETISVGVETVPTDVQSTAQEVITMLQSKIDLLTETSSYEKSIIEEQRSRIQQLEDSTTNFQHEIELRDQEISDLNKKIECLQLEHRTVEENDFDTTLVWTPEGPPQMEPLEPRFYNKNVDPMETRLKSHPIGDHCTECENLKAAVARLEYNLEKYRLARTRLKNMVTLLNAENHQLRAAKYKELSRTTVINSRET